ncbi:MAG: RidA family protein [Proteobacteria bacterium]|nr:RidA family protein [Pseudomonadota bacterium]
MGKVELRLKELGIALPRPPKAVANYLAGVKVGEILYVAGTVGTVVNEKDEDVLTIKGKLGRELTVEQGYQSARYMAINHLAMMKAVIGDLDRIVRIIKMVGYVNAAPGFREAPWVLNGASDLYVQIWGENGKHARAALYQNELTYDAPIEADLEVQVLP